MIEEWKYRPARDLGLSGFKRLKSARREGGLLSALYSLAWSGLVRGHLRVFHRLEIRGGTNLPRKPPFILIANHCSHLDALVLASALPWRMTSQIFPIAAGDTFFETPVLLAFASLLMNALPLWRRSSGAHTLDELRARLEEQDCGYILFPEGTRTRTGELNRFKPGLGRLVAGSPVPVIPCHLRGTFEALPPGRKFPRPAKIGLVVGEPLAFGALPNERPGWNEVAVQCEAAVRKLADAAT